VTAAGLSWQPKKWVTAAVSASSATTPGKSNLFNRYITATLSLAPDNAMPALFISHTQSGNEQLRNSAFTLISATKNFQRWQMFVNGSRIKTFGDTALNVQAGGDGQINEGDTLQGRQ